MPEPTIFLLLAGGCFAWFVLTVMAGAHTPTNSGSVVSVAALICVPVFLLLAGASWLFG